MMKKIPKKLFDEFLQETRKYWLDEANYETTLLLAKELQIKTNVQWIAWKDFINSFLYPQGIARAVTNEQIYEVLKILGWEVVDE